MNFVLSKEFTKYPNIFWKFNFDSKHLMQDRLIIYLNISILFLLTHNDICILFIFSLGYLESWMTCWFFISSLLVGSDYFSLEEAYVPNIYWCKTNRPILVVQNNNHFIAHRLCFKNSDRTQKRRHLWVLNWENSKKDDLIAGEWIHLKAGLFTCLVVDVDYFLGP